MDISSTADPPISTWSTPETTIGTSAASVALSKASINGCISETFAPATTPNASPVDAHAFKDSALLATIPACLVNTLEDNRLLSQITIFENLGTPDSSPDDDFPVLDNFDELNEFKSNPQPGTQENDVPQNNSAWDSNLIEPVYNIVYNASDKATPEVSVVHHAADV